MKRVWALLVLSAAVVATMPTLGVSASAGMLSDLGVDVSMNRFQLSGLMFSFALAGLYVVSRARAK
jgi:hypothetical protein